MYIFCTSILGCSEAAVVAQTDRLSQKAAALLAQFPGPVTLHPSKAKWVVFFLIFALFLGYLTFFLWSHFPRLPMRTLLITGALAASPSLLMIFAAVVTLGRDIPRVRLDADGIETVDLWHTRRLRWTEIERFRSFLLLVVYEDARLPSGRWDSFHRAYLGGSYRMWIDYFGLGPRNLAALITAWRERALVQRR
jgi:hypothetical protein